MPLTDTAIWNAKPTDKPFKLSDSGGLHLLVNPNGSRVWRWKYRLGGKEKLLSIGPYPAVSLAKARERRHVSRALLAAEGTDPSEYKREERQKAHLSAANTFRQVSQEYVAKLGREGRAKATIDKIEWLLGFAYGKLGDRVITEISAAEVLKVLRSVENRGTHETARASSRQVDPTWRKKMMRIRADRVVGLIQSGRVPLKASTIDHRNRIPLIYQQLQMVRCKSTLLPT